MQESQQNAWPLQVGASVTPLGVIAAPCAVLAGIFGATLLGATAYRRSAKRLVRAMEAGFKALEPVSHLPF